MEHQGPYDKAQLLLRYLRRGATPTEQQAVEDWLNENEDNRAFLNQLQSEEGLIEETKFFNQTEKEQAWHQLQKAIRPKTRTLWPRIAAAASIIAILSVCSYFVTRHQAPKNQVAENYHNDIKPGTNGAILTLASGKKIVLEEVKTGKVAKQNGSQINKAGDSLLVYQPMSASKEVSYNTLETPKGKQVELVLPDGSKVWLNAASTLKYPTTFAGKERLVELTGEADFVVMANSKMPFRVKSNGQLTEDVGTEFNINAYPDEPTQRTTLVEGAIKVNGKGLKPGQQAILTGSDISVTDANTNGTIAWKNGDFDFENDNIQTIMRQLARWYDIDVSYQGNSKELFNAQISRKQNISVILNALQRTNGVRFKIEGRRVTVIE